MHSKECQLQSCSTKFIDYVIDNNLHNVYEVAYVLAMHNCVGKNVFGFHANLQSIEN